MDGTVMEKKTVTEHSGKILTNMALPCVTEAPEAAKLIAK